MKSNIYIKKSDVANQRAVENLKRFCSLYKDTGDPKILAKVLEERRKILTASANIYIEQDQDNLFAATVEEIEIITSFLEEE